MQPILLQGDALGVEELEDPTKQKATLLRPLTHLLAHVGPLAQGAGLDAGSHVAPQAPRRALGGVGVNPGEALLSSVILLARASHCAVYSGIIALATFRNMLWECGYGGPVPSPSGGGGGGTRTITPERCRTSASP